MTERKPSRFPIRADVYAWANENFPCSPETEGHRVPWADNAAGETIGESFPARCDREGIVECAIHWRGVG